jgi:uncharacterized glyoxalase superfamily protein PhnB
MAKRKTTAKKSARKTTAKTARRAPAKKASRKAATPRNGTVNQLRTVTPYLAVNDAAGAIAWYKKAFGAKEIDRQPAPGNKLMHAHLKIGDSDVFLSDIFPGSDSVDPTKTGPSVNLHVWSRNVDKLWAGATANGAKVTMPIDDMFWGDRYGKLIDPYGHSWALSYRSKLSRAELEKKREEAMKSFGAPPQ